MSRPVRVRQRRLAEPGHRHRQQPERIGSISSLYGKTAKIPARQVAIEIADDGPITLTGQVDETMMLEPALRLTTKISTQIRSNTVRIENEVTNLNHRRAELKVLYQINYGDPFLQNGARVVAPFRRVAPRYATAVENLDQFDRYAGLSSGFIKQGYSCEPAGRRGSNETVVLLRNSAGTAGPSMRYSVDDLPCFTIWKSTAAREDGYVTGLEPSTNFPNKKRFKRQSGRTINLRGRETRTFTLTLVAYVGRSSVREIENEIVRKRRAKPRVLNRPSSHFSPV